MPAVYFKQGMGDNAGITRPQQTLRFGRLHNDETAMKHLLIIMMLVALAGQVCAQIANPWQQRIGFIASPDLPAMYVFYCGTNSGEYQHRIAFTNTAWATATNELQVGVWKTNFIGGVTNYITATSAVIQGTNLVEGLPAVEINFVPPRPPVLQLRTEILRATDPAGPWETVTNLPTVEVAAVEPKQFFRTRTMITNQSVLTSP